MVASIMVLCESMAPSGATVTALSTTLSTVRRKLQTKLLNRSAGRSPYLSTPARRALSSSSVHFCLDVPCLLGAGIDIGLVGMLPQSYSCYLPHAEHLRAWPGASCVGAHELIAPCPLGFIGVRVVVSEPAYGSSISSAISLSTHSEGRGTYECIFRRPYQQSPE